MATIKRRNALGMLRGLRRPAIFGSLVLLPFVALDLVNRRDYHEGLPLVLFGVMWLLAFFFVLILTSIVRRLPAGERTLASRLGLLPSVVALILIAWLWVGIVNDQMPCFLGVAFCD